MSLYNMLFGMNAQTDLLLAVIGLRQCDVERFRNVFTNEDGSQIEVYTRTGGGNRDDYPNLAMRKRPEWAGSVDDDYDSTYCTDTFDVPQEWRSDVAHLSDILTHGMRPEFAQHLAATLCREPTEVDKATAAYEQESAALKRTRHFMANGHTFVPQDDAAMEKALELAEANGGELRSAWGILPIAVVIKTNFFRWPNARDEKERKHMTRVEVGYDHGWKIDVPYWDHCKEVFSARFPVAMAKINSAVQDHLAKAA